METINVQFLNMDTKIPEQVVKNADGSYTVFLNARMSSEAQQEAYNHALAHIENGDFEKTCADEIEFRAHGLEISLELCPIA